MFDSTSLNHLHLSSFSALAIAALGGVLVGCTVIVGDNVGGHHGDDEQADPWEQCYEQYDDCLDDADGEKAAVEACGKQLDACSHEPGDDATTGADGGGEPTTGSAAEVPAPEVCVALHQTCVAAADDVADTLACEALFDHCAHPGECPECEDGCPEDQLEICLDDYAGCVAAAVKDYEVEACGVLFDGCVAERGATACLSEDDAHTEACLAEHALCTACADSEAELAACKDIFDACTSPPM